MSIALGIFDIFTYIVPGSIYSALFTYLLVRLGWLEIPPVAQINTTLVVIIGLILAYLIGHITYLAGRALRHLLRARYVDFAEARTEFLRRVPTAAGRPFVTAERSVVLAGIEVNQPAPAIEIARLRAVGLMLRNCTPALLLSSFVALAEVYFSGVPVMGLSVFAFFLIAAAGSYIQSQQLTHWADLKTLEVAFWIAELDDRLRQPPSS
jgi:hypothetical protein